MEESSQFEEQSQDAVDPAAVARELDAEIEATEIGDLRQLSFSVPDAADLVLEQAAAIRKFRDAIVDELRRFDVRNVDELSRRAIAAKFLFNAEQVALAAPGEDAKNHLARGLVLRDLLEASCTFNEKLGVPISEGFAKAKKLRRGYGGTSNALQQLEQLMQGHWAQIGPTVPNGEALLTEARTLSVTLSGYRDPDDPETEQAASPHPLTIKRRKAARLLWTSYDRCRAALSFLRWDERDADSIAPALSTASARRAKRDEEPQPDPEPAKPAKPVEPIAPTKPAGPIEPLPDSPFKK